MNNTRSVTRSVSHLSQYVLSIMQISKLRWPLSVCYFVLFIHFMYHTTYNYFRSLFISSPDSSLHLTDNVKICPTSPFWSDPSTEDWFLDFPLLLVLYTNWSLTSKSGLLWFTFTGFRPTLTETDLTWSSPPHSYFTDSSISITHPQLGLTHPEYLGISWNRKWNRYVKYK